MENTITAFEHNIFSKLYGLPSWNVVKGYSSFITCEFGEPQLRITERLLKRHYENVSYEKRLVAVHGAWHLWIYCCDWRMLLHDTCLCHSESPSQSIEKGCRMLDGQALTRVSIDHGTWGTAFHFDLGGVLETRPYQEPDHERANHDNEEGENHEQWSLYCPDSRVFSWYSDGAYTYDFGDIPTDKLLLQYFEWS